MNSNLFPREREVLDLLAQGLTNVEIGKKMHLSINTVKTYLRRLYYKLGVHTRSEAVARAFRLGLIS